MLNESDFKVRLVKQLHARGAFARRHEDRYAVGMLDLAIKIPGHPHLLAECKYIPYQSFAPTKLQWAEGQKYIAAGGLCALIGWSPMKKMYISEWAEEAKKADSFHSDKGDYAEQLEEWLCQRK